MQSKILENKKLVKKGDDAFVDLTTCSMRYKGSGTVINVFFASEDMAMRPDLISYVSYGNTDKFDIICKFNGISNPFSINEGDLIKVPDSLFMYNSIENPSQISISDEVRNQYIDESKGYKVDPNKVEYDKILQNAKNLNNVRFSRYNLPPNIAAPGEGEAKITDDGKIYLGANVTKK